MVERPSETIRTEFGEWIRTQRVLARESQDSAATKADIDRQQWYRIEVGKSGTKRDTVIAMAKAVNADVNVALTKAGFASAGPEEEEGFYKGFKQLPEEKKALARRQLKAIIDSLAEEDEPDTDYI
jgi:DNA-binding XRE family transcriptional regulator